MSAELSRYEQDSRRIEVAKVVGALAAAFPHAQITEDTLRVYVAALADIPLDVLEVAANQCLAECEFFPTVARLRDTALSLTTDLERQPTPFAAWGEVVEAVRRVGYYREPTFSTPLISKAVSIMGWKELCLSDNGVADRAHFVKVYEQLLNRERQGVRLLPESRHMIAMLTSRMSMNQLPAVRKAEPEKGVPPTPEFLDAVERWAETNHDMPESDLEN